MRLLLSTQTKNTWYSLYNKHSFVNSSFLHIPNTRIWNYWLNEVTDKSNNEIIELHFDVINLNPIPNDLGKNKLYINYNWMTMLRDPVERVISEYFYFKKNICNYNFAVWKRKSQADIGKNIIEYAENSFSKNCQTMWLSSKGYLVENKITEEDVDDLIKTMELLDFKVGILEELNKSINCWNDAFGFNLRYEDMGQERVNQDKPIIGREEKDIIRENNTLDVKLYNYYLDKLNNL